MKDEQQKDEQQKDDSAQESESNGEPSAETKNTDSPQPVPYDRFKQVNDKLNTVNQERSDLQARLEELEKAKTDSDRAEMDEIERLKLELTEAQTSTAEAVATSRTASLRSAVEREAAKAGFNDLADAWRMASLDDLEIDEAGNVNGADKAIKALAKAKPYLLRPAAESTNIDATDGRGEGKQSTDPKAYQAELRQRFRL